MITYGGKNYVLKYNMKRIELIEGVTNMPTLADLQRTRGLLSLASLKAYVAYGIKEDGADVLLNPKKGMEIAEPYQKDIDFAFFVVNFGYSRSDYDALTPREIAFIRKAWESKMVADSYNMYNADFTAYFNANRPKRKKALKLWNKKKVKKADMEVIRDNLKIIRDVEKTEGTGWVDAIYKANNLPPIRRP